MPLVLAISLAGEVQNLRGRIDRLEEALSVSLHVLQAITERLEAKFGADVIGEDLKQRIGVISDAELAAVHDRITDALKNGDKSEAKRLFRDASGCTWDEAHEMIRLWHSQTRNQRLTRLRVWRFLHNVPTAD